MGSDPEGLPAIAAYLLHLRGPSKEFKTFCASQMVTRSHPLPPQPAVHCSSHGEKKVKISAIQTQSYNSQLPAICMKGKTGRICSGYAWRVSDVNS